MSVGVVHVKPGLWYGLAATSELKEEVFVNDDRSFVLATSSTEPLMLRASPRSDASVFYRIKVEPIRP